MTLQATHKRRSPCCEAEARRYLTEIGVVPPLQEALRDLVRYTAGLEHPPCVDAAAIEELFAHDRALPCLPDVGP
jgi:hypothetical protein